MTYQILKKEKNEMRKNLNVYRMRNSISTKYFMYIWGEE